MCINVWGVIGVKWLPLPATKKMLQKTDRKMSATIRQRFSLFWHMCRLKGAFLNVTGKMRANFLWLSFTQVCAWEQDTPSARCVRTNLYTGCLCVENLLPFETFFPTPEFRVNCWRFDRNFRWRQWLRLYLGLDCDYNEDDFAGNSRWKRSEGFLSWGTHLLQKRAKITLNDSNFVKPPALFKPIWPINCSCITHNLVPFSPYVPPGFWPSEVWQSKQGKGGSLSDRAHTWNFPPNVKKPPPSSCLLDA